MKKVLLIILCNVLITKAYPQIREIDSLQHILATTKDDTTRVKVLATLSLYEPSFEIGLRLAQDGLALAQKIKYKNGEAQCLNQIGNQYAVQSHYPIALQYYLQGLQLREKINDSVGIGNSNGNIGFVYRNLGDYEMAKSYFMKALQIQLACKDNHGLAITSADVGSLYEQMKKLDSALYYYQRSYEYFNLSKVKYQLASALNGLASIQNQLGNKELSLNYYRLAIDNGLIYSDSLNLPGSFLGMAVLFKHISQPDSSIVYAKKALESAQTGRIQHIVISASRLLSQLYQHRNDTEALRYLNIAMETSDSALSKERDIQIQNLSYAEKERQKEITQIRIKEAEERKHNLQYAAIAVAIIIFTGLYLLLSRSIIVNEKWIKFLGVLGLLAVFEFINLLIHPYLANFTHHSPVLMLLALVAIAALLVPLHHKLEHWLTHQMIVKNKRLRLTAAKRTITRLESDPDIKQ
jgi:tetratricopeptide (TPR) repeat protein